MTAVLKPLPPREAIAAMRRRGANLAPSFAWQDVWQDEHQKAFTVAKSTGFDILADIRDAVEDALADGSTLRDFEGRLQPVLEAKGWWGKQEVTDPLSGEIVDAQLGSSRRLKTIFETNLRTAYAQGHWARFERDKKDRPWLRYVALMDGRARPAHAARHNVCLPVDHPFWKKWAPPNGWGCRCTLQSLSDRDVARLQRDGVPLRFDAPDDLMVDYANPRDFGNVTPTPQGIDPGWAYNPGEVSFATASAISRTLAGPPGMTSKALEAMPPKVRDEAYRRWITAYADGVQVNVPAMPVGRLPDYAAALSRASGDEKLIVMPQSIPYHALRPDKREMDREPDLRVLLRAPQLLANPIAILRERNSGALIYLVGRDERQWTRIVVQPGFSMKTLGEGWRGTAVRAAVRTVDRIALETYPNAGSFDLVWGNI